MDTPLLLPVSTAASASSSITIDDEHTAVEHSNSASPSSSSPSTQSIVGRLLAVVAVAAVSLFAQHEASKGFRIDVVNASPRGTPAARRFDLFFVSNGQAARVLHYASSGVERALFPDASFPRKHVARVTVQMAGHNLTGRADATVELAAGRPGGGEYVISLSPELMARADGSSRDAAVAAAVRRAVARMWLWDGRGAAPERVTESMVEYLAGAGAEDDVDAHVPWDASADAAAAARCMSPRFLRHLEEHHRGGFVARLNRAMRDRWSDAAVDAALGSPARPVCAAYRAATSLSGGQLAH